MSLSYSCSILSPHEFTQSVKWDFQPFLSDTEPVSQSSASIERIGILVPPLVQQREDGKFDFICGRRCFNVLQRITPGANICCRVLSPDVPPISILQLLYEDASARRTLSPIELACFFKIAQAHLPSKTDAKKLYGELGLQANTHFIDRSLRLLSLEPEIQRQVISGKIPENVGRELLKLKTEDRHVSFDIICRLNLGGGKQRRLLSLMKDVAGRDGRSFEDLICEEEISAVLHHPQMNIPQKSHALLLLLQQRQTPSLHNAEAAFTAWRSNINLPEDYTVDHSPAFEQDEVTLSLTFTDRSQLERCIPELRSLSNKKKKNQG